MSRSAPLALASAFFVLLIVIAIPLIAVLDAEIRRAVARSDRARARLDPHPDRKDATP